MKSFSKVFKRWVLIPIGLTIAVYGTIRLVNDSATETRIWLRPWETNVSEFLGALFLVYLLMVGIRYFTKRFNKKTFKDTKKQIAYEVRVIAIFTIIVGNAIGLCVMAFFDNGIQPHDPVIMNVTVLSFTLFIFVYRRANYYLQASTEHKIKAEKLAREKVETELKFLKAQINPHFLFNAINNIYHLIVEDKDKAQKTLDEFSQMLRYQLYECNDDRVPLEKELKYIKNYIAVQKIRHSKKLNIQLDFPENNQMKTIAPFLFLPLVENAYKYVGGDYWIHLQLDQDSKWINFKAINSINQGAQNGFSEGNNNGIGLENLHRRLNLLYPEKHQIDIKKEEDRFEVNLKVAAI